MAKPIVDNDLWASIEPLLPSRPRRARFPGRKPLDNRKALTGILFVLKTGVAWEDLPQELGCGSGMSCWRRLREWQRTGVWQTLQQRLRLKLPDAHKIRWSRADWVKPGSGVFPGAADQWPRLTDGGLTARTP